MNVSRTIAPNRIIITHRYAVTTGSASLCIFTGFSFSRDAFCGCSTSGTARRVRRAGYVMSGLPPALDRPGHRSGYRSHEGAGHEVAEEGGETKDDRLHPGASTPSRCATETRRAAVVRRHPKR